MKYEEILEKSIYKHVPMTEEDLNFVSGIADADNQPHNVPYLQKKTANAIFYLAKRIEESDKANQKNANKMFWLTLVIGFFSILQLIELILKLCGITQ